MVKSNILEASLITVGSAAGTLTNVMSGNTDHTMLSPNASSVAPDVEIQTKGYGKFLPNILKRDPVSKISEFPQEVQLALKDSANNLVPNDKKQISYEFGSGSGNMTVISQLKCGSPTGHHAKFIDIDDDNTFLIIANRSENQKKITPSISFELVDGKISASWFTQSENATENSPLALSNAAIQDGLKLIAERFQTLLSEKAKKPDSVQAKISDFLVKWENELPIPEVNKATIAIMNQMTPESLEALVVYEGRKVVAASQRLALFKNSKGPQEDFEDSHATDLSPNSPDSDSPASDFDEDDAKSRAQSVLSALTTVAPGH